MKIKFPSQKTILLGALLLIPTISCTLQGITLHYTTNAMQRMEQQWTKSESVYQADAPMIASDAIYRLYECGGKIGIYDAKTEVLIDIIDVLVFTLPAADRLSLKKGIEIYTFSDLAKIIEDFST